MSKTGGVKPTPITMMVPKALRKVFSDLEKTHIYPRFDLALFGITYALSWLNEGMAVYSHTSSGVADEIAKLTQEWQASSTMPNFYARQRDITQKVIKLLNSNCNLLALLRHLLNLRYEKLSGKLVLDFSVSLDVLHKAYDQPGIAKEDFLSIERGWKAAQAIAKGDTPEKEHYIMPSSGVFSEADQLAIVHGFFLCDFLLQHSILPKVKLSEPAR